MNIALLRDMRSINAVLGPALRGMPREAVSERKAGWRAIITVPSMSL